MIVAASLVAMMSIAGAGKSVAVVVAPKDTPSGQAAVVIGRHARDAFWDGWDLLDVERFLQGGEASIAEQKAKEGRSALERGKVALDALELAPAVEALAEAAVAFEQAAGASVDAVPLVEALMYQGAAWALQGDAKNAARSFDRALAIDPGVDLPQEFPPQVGKAWAEAQKRAETAGKGTLTVYATPAAAEVWVDGKFKGASPVVLDGLAVGRHIVRVWREGYEGFGTVADVKKSAEVSVQATLRPTSKFSQYDDRVARLSGGANAAADLAAFLKVDQMFSAVVETKGQQATVSGRMTDGVTGKELVAASKAFELSSPNLERDVKQWVRTAFQEQQGGTTTTTTETPKEQFLPGERKVETPGTLIAGWVLVGTSAVPAVAGLVLGIYSVYTYDVYRNKLPDQRDPQLNDVRSVWAVTAVAADVCGAVFVGMLGGGIALVVIGSNQKAQLEDVLE